MITILPTKTPAELRLILINEQLQLVENYAKGATHALNTTMDLCGGRFKSLPGVYVILNKVNHKIYVGESLNIKARMFSHLGAGKQILHRAIKKYGRSEFLVVVRYIPGACKPTLLDAEEAVIVGLGSLTPAGCNAQYQWTANRTTLHPSNLRKKHAARRRSITPSLRQAERRRT